MTRNQAIFVKYLRVRLNGSYRFIAEQYFKRYKNYPDEVENKQCGLQESGMWLVDYATDTLEESLLEWDLDEE